MQSKLNFSLTQLDYVLALNRFGSFSKAAKHCHITQPTLSMQIQKLEDELGIILFDRSKKPILMTDQGRAVIEQMQLVVFEAKKIQTLLHAQSSSGVRGSLAVGIIPTVAPDLLPLLLPAMHQRYPDIQLRLFEMQTDAIIDALSRDEIDLGIAAIPLAQAHIHEQQLYTETFAVLCQKTHPLARHKHIDAAKLAGDDIWLLQEGHCLRGQVLDACSLSGQQAQTRAYQFESGSLETLKNLVNTYGGYTLLPQLSCHTCGPNTVVVPIAPPVPARAVGLVYIREHYKRALHRALSDTISHALAKALKTSTSDKTNIVPVR